MVKLPAFDPGHLSTSRHPPLLGATRLTCLDASMPRCLDVSSAPGLELSCSVEKGLAWPWAHPVWVTWGATWRHSPPNVACTMYNDYYGSLWITMSVTIIYPKHIQTSVDCDLFLDAAPVCAKGLQSCHVLPQRLHTPTKQPEQPKFPCNTGNPGRESTLICDWISTDIGASLITLYISVLSGTAKIPMLCPTARNFAKDAAFCLPSSSEVKRQSQHWIII